MSGLLYREDFDEVRDRLTAWWNGEDIGRPVMLITAPREEPLEHVPEMPAPGGSFRYYTTRDFEFRVNLSRRHCTRTHYLGEAVPNISPDLAPNCLALYLGCRGVERPDTVWCEPCIDSPGTASFELDGSNFYWDFSLRLAKEQRRVGDGKFIVSFPDLIEGLDTLAAMRGTETLLTDLIERPEWVRASLRPITQRYFDCYDVLYDLIKDDRGGSHYWMWAPGRMTKLQCDFSAMISPEMFGEFMLPVLREMTERLDYCMYHWDGPGALPHFDHLLSLPRLDMIQWTPGAGTDPVMDRRWWPLYHVMIEAGKKVILIDSCDIDRLSPLKREFGDKLGHFAISMRAENLQQAQEILNLVSQ